MQQGFIDSLILITLRDAYSGDIWPCCIIEKKHLRIRWALLQSLLYTTILSLILWLELLDQQEIEWVPYTIPLDLRLSNGWRQSARRNQQWHDAREWWMSSRRRQIDPSRICESLISIHNVRLEWFTMTHWQSNLSVKPPCPGILSAKSLISKAVTRKQVRRYIGCEDAIGGTYLS